MADTASEQSIQTSTTKLIQETGSAVRNPVVSNLLDISSVISNGSPEATIHYHILEPDASKQTTILSTTQQQPGASIQLVQTENEHVEHRNVFDTFGNVTNANFVLSQQNTETRNDNEVPDNSGQTQIDILELAAMETVVASSQDETSQKGQDYQF